MIHNDYLVADANIPLISCDRLKDELLIYNLEETATAILIDQFAKLTGKKIDKSYRITELSGGQKVILMALLAIYSPAPKIRFVNLLDALDPKRREAIQILIQDSGKDIILEDKL